LESSGAHSFVMPISWNEIRHNAIKFSRDWAGVRSERAEKQTFWNEFFEVFGDAAGARNAVATLDEQKARAEKDASLADVGSASSGGGGVAVHER